MIYPICVTLLNILLYPIHDLSVANVGLVYIYISGGDYRLNIMLPVECHERTYCHGNPWGDV